ncbi:MAG: caspase family protein [Nitrospirae bacterium]|nr:caspase family protein [Nitrospirota bacterium]
MKQRLYKFIPLSVFIFLLAVSNVLADDPILTLDTGGHMAAIKKIITMKDGKHIISASDDKTIRIWDIETGIETQKILGQISGGGEGKIFAIALTPDERWLAVGGYLAGESNEDKSAIRIYDLTTGKLSKVLKSHNNKIEDLSISNDGRYLVSGSSDSTVKVWDINNNFSLVSTLSGHTTAVFAVAIFKEDNDYKIVSAGDDNKLKLWSLNENKELISYTHSDKLRFLAVNEKYIATCGFGKEILIFNHKLINIQNIGSITVPKGLSFSPDGKLLAAGASSPPRTCYVYDSTDNFKKISSFDKHDNVTMAVTFVDNHTVATGGGDNKEIYIWDAYTGIEKKLIKGHGNTIWLVGIKGKEIAFRTTFLPFNEIRKHLGDFEKKINLETFTVSKVTDDQEYKRIEKNYQGFSLKHRPNGQYGYQDSMLQITENGKDRGLIIRDATNGYRHCIYGFTGFGAIISGGLNGFLTAYDSQGQKTASFIGHTGQIWAAAIEGDTLVTGSDDQTIRIWDLKELKAGKIKIYPMLSIFISDDNEWVTWTNEGFFNASKNGARYITYHINKGSDNAAGNVTVDKLYNSFYRPDLIEARLNIKDISQYAKDININQLLKGGLPPRVEMITASGTAQTKDIKLKARLCDTGEGIGDVTMYINDVPVSIEQSGRGITIKGSKQSKELNCADFEKLISLQQGTNKIGIMAMNKGNTIESNKPEIELIYKSKTIEKPDLHIMTIAINKYNDIDLRLKYSVNDANGIIETIKKRSAPLFNKIHVYSIHDKEATKNNIQKMFEQIKTSSDDVFILFIAGHGITYQKDGSYYYIPVDFRYTSNEAIPITGVSIDDFKRYLTNIKALKSLLLVDTCNSGSFSEAIASRGMLEKTAVNKLTRAIGRSTIVASSKDQVALEGIEGHGVFTFSVLKAFNGLGNYKNNQLTINALATIVEETLPEITMKKWGYEQIPQKNLQGMDFPIGVTF